MCPYCSTTIAWYDNIPVFSWLQLRGSCRTCKKNISFLYPFIELLTAITLTALYLYIPHQYFASYFVFISALIVTIRSDLETMLISRYVTLFLLPLGIIFSALGMLPINVTESIVGAFFGYGILFSIATVFHRLTGKHGLGEGDMDLLALIGSFTGIIGCWATILIGSISGSILGLLYMHAYKPTEQIKIPFGPFLAFGALAYIFFQDAFAALLLGA